jgi:mRNA interferase RelE/StbE
VAAYNLYIKPSAGREIDGVGSKKDRRRIVGRIRELGDAPRPIGSEKLAGRDDCYRIRVGDYRVVYSIDDARREIVILKVGHRREVYRDR